MAEIFCRAELQSERTMRVAEGLEYRRTRYRAQSSAGQELGSLTRMERMIVPPPLNLSITAEQPLWSQWTWEIISVIDPHPGIGVPAPYPYGSRAWLDPPGRVSGLLGGGGGGRRGIPGGGVA